MSANAFELDLVVRSDMGKGASRRLRRNDKMVPGILYGAHKEATPIQLEQKVLVKALENEAFYTKILTVNVDGKKERCILRDLQRHPYKPVLLHVDFQRISETEKLHLVVPIHFLNQEVCPGIKAGGIISHTMPEVEIRCLPKDLPEYLEVDMSAVELDQIIHLSEIKLPAGVEIVDLQYGADHDFQVASIHLPRRPAQGDEEEIPTDAPVALSVPALKQADVVSDTSGKSKAGGGKNDSRNEKKDMKQKKDKK